MSKVEDVETAEVVEEVVEKARKVAKKAKRVVVSEEAVDESRRAIKEYMVPFKPSVDLKVEGSDPEVVSIRSKGSQIQVSVLSVLDGTRTSVRLSMYRKDEDCPSGLDKYVGSAVLRNGDIDCYLFRV
jgi:hypothetical protein